MTNALKMKTSRRLQLVAETAADLMTPNPVSICGNATVQEVLELLTDKGICAAPVIDDAGRPVGVVSRSDILIHDREKAEVSGATAMPGNRHASDADRTQVEEIMTPVVFSVAPETPAAKVVEELLSLRVHRLFVVDVVGVLVGVISTHDVLRRLQ